MAATLHATGRIALLGAPDNDIGSRDHSSTPLQAMQVDITQDIIDQLLDSVRNGHSPRILFGKQPQLKYGDKSHALQSSPETHRYELYKSSDNDEFEFAGLINHTLTVQRAEDVTAGVDSALEQLRSSMAAISELKEANKTIVGDTPAARTSGHRRFPSNSFRAQHLAPSKVGSPLLSAPSSPMHKRGPTSQPNNNHDLILNALRIPIIHLLAKEPATDDTLATTCRAPISHIREFLPKIAKRSSQDTDKWQLTDKSWREVNPYKFPYQSSEDRQQAIECAIKAFDRQRLAKDDKLWQILLPREERGQGICLSRSKVKAPDALPKASTPMHKIADLTKKKPTAEKKPVEKKPVMKKAAEEKAVEKKTKPVKDAEPRAMTLKEKYLARDKSAVKEVKEKEVKPKDEPGKANGPSTVAPSERNVSADTSKIRTKKTPASSNSTPRVNAKIGPRDTHRDRPARPIRPPRPVNTKPKNPSPLSASPPVNASDFEDSHPVHKALAGAPSPVKGSGNSDRTLKSKANDIDSNIHNHNLAVKKPNIDRSTPNHTPSHTNGRLNGSTPSSTSSANKRKYDESSSSTTPTTAPKVRKVTNIDTGLASRYHHNNPRASPGASSSSTTSPTMPNLSFRQTVELSQKFQKYYKRYEELYWQLTEAEKPPTETQRNDLLKMHKKLEEMKREIKAGAGHR